MFCKNCGQKLSRKEKFCPSCGQKKRYFFKAHKSSDFAEDNIVIPEYSKILSTILCFVNIILLIRAIVILIMDFSSYGTSYISVTICSILIYLAIFLCGLRFLHCKHSGKRKSNAITLLSIAFLDLFFSLVPVPYVRLFLVPTFYGWLIYPSEIIIKTIDLGLSIILSITEIKERGFTSSDKRKFIFIGIISVCLIHTIYLSDGLIEVLVNKSDYEVNRTSRRTNFNERNNSSGLNVPFSYIATSYLSEVEGTETVQYSPMNLAVADGWPWIPANCEKTQGIGEQIIIETLFDSNMYLEFKNGFTANDSYEKYSRAARISIEIKETGIEKFIELKDTSDIQKISLDDLYTGDNQKDITIVIKILEVYPGTESSRLCIDSIRPAFK